MLNKMGARKTTGPFSRPVCKESIMLLCLPQNGGLNQPRRRHHVSTDYVLQLILSRGPLNVASGSSQFPCIPSTSQLPTKDPQTLAISEQVLWVKTLPQPCLEPPMWEAEALAGNV